MKFFLFIFVLVLTTPFTVQATDCRGIFNDAEALEEVACCDVDLPVFVGFGVVPNYVVGCDSTVFRDRFNLSRSTCLSRGEMQDQTLSGIPPYHQPWSRDCNNLPPGEAILSEDDLDGDGSPDSEDCNDNSAAIHPGAVELCDGIDNDCDGTIDNGLPQTTWYRDRDGDGHGSVTSVTRCAPPSGYVSNHDDCNDFRGNVYPGAPEICDDWDNDCDGDLNEESDADGDGFIACANDYSYQDCNDTNAAVFPGMIEITCNGLDDDCNSSTPDNVNCPAETDGHGYPGWEGDEEDQNTNVNPPSTEPPDVDASGYPGWEGDEEDQNTNVNPPSTEPPDVDAPGYPGWEGDREDQNADIFPGPDESSPGSPDVPDVPADESDTATVPETTVPSSEGESTIGESLPTDDDPDEELPTGETTYEGETEGGSFKLIGGRGCSLFPGRDPAAVGLLSLWGLFFLPVLFYVGFRLYSKRMVI